MKSNSQGLFGFRGRQSRVLLVVAASVFAVASARADNLENFTFSGTLAQSSMGQDTVSGTFTLDTSGAGSITAFDFTTPDAAINAIDGWTPVVYTLTPAYSPAADFVQIGFLLAGDSLVLSFETALPTFSGSTFYLGAIEPTQSSTTGSALQCSDPIGCSASFFSGFTSGSATPVTTSAVPEPRSSFLLGSVLLAVTVVLVRRRTTLSS
ncbi:MAG TPA: PEP-CTERM sorting domain-containing protein [Bryobacteraceae bacterium]|nr:PEP-CTERM sorting domain-containing protein [Bryobacteraceae bacterium]